MQKFLIIQTAFIGDVVLATVIIEKLHANFPDARIDFLLRKGNEGLLSGHPYLNEVLIWDKKKDKTKNLFRLIGTIRKKNYDKVINVQRYFSTGLITSMSSASEKIGFDKNPLSFLFDVRVKHQVGTDQDPVHEVQRNLSLIKKFTNNVIASMRLYPPAEDYEKARAIVHGQWSMVNGQWSGNYICVAPSSVWFTKQYPKEKWIDFLQKVPVQLHLFFLGAANDEDLCGEIIAALPGHNSVNLCGKVSYLVSAALMQHAMMNYVNDSAPLHIASAMNAPVTAVFCSTVLRFGYGPVNDNGHVVQINYNLYCRPCTLHGKRYCPEKHFKCALDIETQQLLQTLPAKKEINT